MQITFCGAARMVTGSCYLIETDKAKFIVDCGMFQGGKAVRSNNQEPFMFNPTELDFMLLSHAHVDHSGLIPRLCKQGFNQPIYSTKATVKLSEISLPDSGYIQEMEAEWRNRKRLRQGLSAEEPLYTVDDALESLKIFVSCDYEQEFQPAPGVKVRFQDAGHIMGSAIIEIWVTEGNETTKVVFSGDLGQKNQPIIEDPTYVQEADYILVESTYGSRLHQAGEDRTELLQKVIMEMLSTGGNLIIPAFAVGRTQDLLYHIKNLLMSGKIPRVPVYIDSPMAVSVTKVYRESQEYYDAETMNMLKKNANPFEFEGLHFVSTVEESKLLNQNANRSIIISASGMCEAGRILHHLKHNLWRADSHVLFAGYQAEGTLGRRLLEGAKVVKIMGDEVNVQAKIHSIDGFSAHADQDDILDWLGGFENPPRGLFLVHGEYAAQQELAARVQEKFGFIPDIPTMGESFALNAAAHRSSRVEKIVPNTLMLDKTLTDLEHMVLAFRSQMLHDQREDTKTKIAAMRELLAKLEKEIAQ